MEAQNTELELRESKSVREQRLFRPSEKREQDEDKKKDENLPAQAIHRRTGFIRSRTRRETIDEEAEASSVPEVKEKDEGVERLEGIRQKIRKFFEERTSRFHNKYNLLTSEEQNRENIYNLWRDFNREFNILLIELDKLIADGKEGTGIPQAIWGEGEEEAFEKMFAFLEDLEKRIDVILEARKNEGEKENEEDEKLKELFGNEENILEKIAFLRKEATLYITESNAELKRLGRNRAERLNFLLKGLPECLEALLQEMTQLEAGDRKAISSTLVATTSFQIS